MQKLYFFIILLFTGVLNSCKTPEKKNESLSGKKMEAYLKCYTELSKNAPEFLTYTNNENVDIQKKGYNDFEKIIKNNDLTFKEFVIINAKVGAVYSLIKADDFMNQIEKMKNEGMDQMDAGMMELQKQVNDPAIPESAKEELKKTLEQMKANKKIVNTEYNNNKDWAVLVMDKTKSITNIFISKKEIELVEEYFDKITEAYSKVPAPTNFNIS